MHSQFVWREGFIVVRQEHAENGIHEGGVLTDVLGVFGGFHQGLLQGIHAPHFGSPGIDPVYSRFLFALLESIPLFRQQVADQIRAEVTIFTFPPRIVNVEFGIERWFNPLCGGFCGITHDLSRFFQLR